MMRGLATIALVSALSLSLHAQGNDAYFTVNHAKASALGMAGAVTAVESNLSSAFFNPATFRLARVPNSSRLSAFFSPVSSLSVYAHYKNDPQEGLDISNWWNILRVLPKAIVVSAPNWEFALIGHEELYSRSPAYNNHKFFEADSLFNHVVHTALVRIKLAEQLYFGGSVNYYIGTVGTTEKNQIGSSYGIYLLPSSKFRAGVLFIDLPDDRSNERLTNDRLEDETVNIGVAYHFLPSNTLAFDIRNISEEEGQTTREWHLGIKQDIWRHITIRGGFYRISDTKTNNVALGLGLFDQNVGRNGFKKFYNRVMALNYSMVLARQDSNTHRSHFLTLNLVF